MEIGEPHGVDPEAGRRSRRHRAWWAFGPPLLALLAGWALLAYQSPFSGRDLFLPSSWGRWDSGQYAKIARVGYTAAFHCSGHALPPHLPPGNYLCGTIGWFPGYPAVSWLVSHLPIINLNGALLLVAWSCWYLVLILMWHLLADARSAWIRWLCLGIAAVSPGQVYFAAIFPISLCVAGILGCCYVAFRTTSRTALILGVIGGLLAGFSYFSAVVAGPAILIAALVCLRGPALRRALICGLAPLAGFAGVLLTMQVAVGIWDAYFISAKKYGVSAHSPLQTLDIRLRPLWTRVPPARLLSQITAEQTLLALCLLVLGVLATVVSWTGVSALRTATRPPVLQEPAGTADVVTGWARIVARVPALDLCFLLLAGASWAIPYVAGGNLSIQRSESFVILTVPLLRRLPAWVLVILLAGGSIVAWRMAPNFFNSKLV
ncbi:hypothetical protein BH10ACT8_BH10ACT8_03510 [soil metagenome]